MADVDPDVLRVLEYVSRGRRFVDVGKYPDASARRALGRIYDAEAAEADVVRATEPDPV